MKSRPILFLVSAVSVSLGVWLGRQAPVAERIEPYTALTGEVAATTEVEAEVVKLTLSEALNMADPFERDLAIRQIIAAMPVGEFGAAFQSLGAEFERSGDLVGDQRRTGFHLEVQRILLQRWARLGAESALATIEQLLVTLDGSRDVDSHWYDQYDQVDTDEMVLIAAFFDAWFRAEPSRVLATIESWKDRPNQQGASFIESLRLRLVRENPASAFALFELDRNAEAPFSIELYYHALQLKLEESPLVALRFVAENADYVPPDAWSFSLAGLYSPTLFDLARKQNFQGAYELWEALESNEFKAEFAHDSIDYALREGDL
ncbi:MAG: hypothetical protein ACSHYA_19815 [Opitutaceae bacterium]